MGPQQVLRAAALVAVTAVSAVVHAQAGSQAGADTVAPATPAGSTAPASVPPAAPPSIAAGVPVVVVDLSGEPASAAALRQELRTAGFAVLSAPDLDAANAGIEGGKDLAEALASLELARSSFGALDCPGASVAAETAIATLSSRAASGVDVTASLITAWSYLLLCRDGSGDFDGAMRAAQALRALSATTPATPAPAAAPAFAVSAIPAAVWSKYPEVDATANRDISELTIIAVSGIDSGADPDATIMIDHRPAGSSPATVFVPAGRHIVAAAQGSRRAALWIDVSTRSASVALRLFEQDAPLSRISERVTGWKHQPPAGSHVATYLENLLTAAQGQPWNPSSARSPLLVILGPAGDPRRAQLWASDGPGEVPTVTEVKLEGSDAVAHAAPIIAALRGRSLLWRDRAPDPDQLLVESPEERNLQREEPSRRPQWWVYAAIAGAVVVGGAVIVANELSEDTQRVELRFP